MQNHVRQLKALKLQTTGGFSMDPIALYLFSSNEGSMMPGDISLRYVKVEEGASNDKYIKEMRAQDRILSMFNKEVQTKIDLQKGWIDTFSFVS